MITRMNTSDRAEMMRESRDRLAAVYCYLSDILYEKLAPYDTRNYTEGDGTGNLVEYGRAYDDKDAQFMWDICQEVDKVLCRLKERVEELEIEEMYYDEGTLMFLAWENGLCPYVMREYREKEKVRGQAGDILTWEEIADYLDGRGISIEGTRKAVEAWSEAKCLKEAV